MFGAVGNLHIALFEILFKNPFYLQEYNLMVDDWEAGGTEGNTPILKNHLTKH